MRESVFVWVSVVLLFPLFLAGCIQEIPYFEKDMRLEGPKPLINKEIFREIDLALLLDPGSKQNDSEKKRLRQAFVAFYKNAAEQQERRNRVQDTIMAASNQRCAEYKQHLKRFDRYTDTLFGMVTTAAAGLGAIFSSASTVRALSGAAAISAGSRSVISEVSFQEKTIQVLTIGFEKRREEISKEIMDKRKDADISKYTVEGAIADAIRYHDACSLIGGLEQVAKDQQRAQDPGLKAMTEYLDNFEDLKQKLNSVLTDSE